MKKGIIAVVYTVLLAITYLMPMEGLAQNGKIALLVFFWAIGLWIIRPIPELLTSLIAVTFLLLTKAAGAEAVSGFNLSWWMVTFACLLGATISYTGLGRRGAFFLLSKVGSNILRVMYATTFANNLLAPFTPSNTARGAIMAGIVEGICEKMGIKPGERKGDHTLMLANMYTNTTNTCMFLTATGANIISVSLIAEITGQTVNWSDWFIASFVPILPVLLLLPLIIYKMFPPESKTIDMTYAKQELEEMGPMTHAEKATLVIMLCALVLWATQIWHQIPADKVGFIMACALLFPKFGAVSWKEMQDKMPWAMVLWLGFAMSLGNVVNKTGGFKWLINQAFVASPFLANLEYIPFLVILITSIVFMHIAFSGMNAMVMIMIPVAVSLAALKGYDPYAVGLITSLAAAGGAFFLPFNSAPNMIFYSYGRYTVKDHIMGAIPLAILIVLALLFALFVWWPIIGLI